MLLAHLQLRILPSARGVSAAEWRLHIDFGLLLGPKLQCHIGNHDRNVPARELRRNRPDLLNLCSLLLGTFLLELEPHRLYRRRLALQLLRSAELARCERSRAPRPDLG